MLEKGFWGENLMELNYGEFFRACNPTKTLDMGKAEDRQYYIDFSSVRGNNVIGELKRTIIYSEDEPTCQLFTGHIGCGKSTELLRLKTELEEQGFHVVYFESSQDLDMADVDISDILLAIARKVSQSLEEIKIKLQPTRFKQLLRGTSNLLTSEVKGIIFNPLGLDKVGLEENALSFGIGQIITKAKDSKDLRSLLRQHLEPQVSNIIEAINKELIEPAQKQLKEKGKAGLVVIVDNLDRIHNRPKLGERMQPEYLFIDRGEQLNQLKCHVVYTIPLVLVFSNEIERLINRFGSKPQLLPMVRVRDPDGTPCEEGIALLRQMVLARVFPALEPEQRLSLIEKVFAAPEILDRLCQFSGGHPRNLLVLLLSCLKKDDPPLSPNLLGQVISERRNELSKVITPNDWELLRQVAREKTVRGQEEFQTLLESLFVFEYHDNEESWFDINPVLTDAKELGDD